MSGHFSRRKGMRNEYLLRDYFRSLGYKSERVPSSGASAAVKGDVQLWKEEDKSDVQTAELKVRATEYQSVYDCYVAANSGFETEQGILLPALDGKPGILVSKNYGDIKFEMSQDFRAVSDITVVLARRKLMTLYKYAKHSGGDSDFIVIKIDRQPFLFVKYFG